MNDRRIYRWAGACGLLSIALFFVEFPFYLVRGPVPGPGGAVLVAYFARNASNMLAVVFLDLLIYALFLVFLAGFRHLLRQADPACEWLGSLFLGVGVVYTTVTLIADSFQGAAALDALGPNPDPSVLRVLMEAQYLLFGSVGLLLIALLLIVASGAAQLSRALPRWAIWLGDGAALLCLLFVPSMFAGAPNLQAFYNPAGWGTTGVVAGFPLAAWTIAVSVLMLRGAEAVNRDRNLLVDDSEPAANL